LSMSKRPKNAISHGVYFSDVVLPWENEQLFNDLHQALREEYYPDGVSEEAAVFELASLYRKRRRLTIGIQLAFHGQADADALAEAGDDGWEGVARYLKKTSADGDRVCDVARALANSHTKVVTKVLDEINQCIGDESKQKDPAVLDNLILLAKKIDDVGKDVVVPMLRITETYDVDQKIAERAYRPDLMEKELKVLAHIDRQITKAMESLVRAKEYKKFYGRLAIEAQSTKVVNLPAGPIGNSAKDD
jgi:hypothetical protein